MVAGVVGDSRPGGLSVNTWLGISTAAAGIAVLCLAPVIGQRADAGGHRRRNLAVWSALVIATMLGLFTVKDDPSYLWIALVLLAAGAVFQELAGVSYNAMLEQVSTPQTYGRVSGFGWSMGYFGGIIVLTLCLFAFVKPEVGWFGLTANEGLKYRAVAIFASIWFAVFALPVLFAVPEKPPGPARAQVSFRASYGVLVADVRRLYRTDRNAVMFLIASALYRDGLTAIFTFGAVLAVSVYGFTPVTVVYFGVAANVVAAVGALVLGRLEDRVGPEADHHGLADLPDHHRHDPAVRQRHHHVLDLRAAALPVGRTGPGQLAVLPGAGRTTRPGGRDVRAVRNDRAGGVLSGARRCWRCSPDCSPTGSVSWPLS